MFASRLRLLTMAAAGAMIAAAAPVGAQGQGASAPRLSVPPIAYKSRKLANGLTVYTLRDTSTPNVSVSVWYEVGAKHDPAGRSGFAHLFEHILSRKTVNMPYNMINRLTEDVGGIRNASTSWDRTNYYETVPARYLETMLWTHAERMARPVVDADVFEKERNVVKEELRQRVLAPPYGRLFSFVTIENAWDRMPHRRPTIGSIADLDAAKLEDARAFHEAYYGPDTASIIVAGNFDEAQLGAWIDRYFGAIRPAPRRFPLTITERDPPRTRSGWSRLCAQCAAAGGRARSGRRPVLPTPTFPRCAFSRRAELRATAAALPGVGAEGPRHQRLQQSDRHGGKRLLRRQRHHGRAGKALPDAETALAAEIERVRTQPVTAAELARPRTSWSPTRFVSARRSRAAPSRSARLWFALATPARPIRNWRQFSASPPLISSVWLKNI
jgi:zinc protease